MAAYKYKFTVNIKQLFHWGPLIALSVIFIISFTGLRCVLVWWPPVTVGGIVHVCIYCNWIFLVLYNYLLAAFKGPGFVPRGWKPKHADDQKYLQYCSICEGFKSPRSHHCRKCERCVMKMDHHCPWINTCCGHFNHANFVWFLFFAPVGCVHACVVLIISTYRAVHWQYYTHFVGEPTLRLGVAGFILSMFAIGLSIGVFIAVGMLWVIQMKSIMKNETGIESWIIDKAEDRERTEEEGEFVYPYNFGRWNNLKQVFTWSGLPVSDGIIWPVREGCNQYSLTIEQLCQKQLKRERTVEYTIRKDYNGSWLPICLGCRVLCNIPCTDEPRIPVKVGQKVQVTRWKKKWLYGTRILSSEEKKENKRQRIRGWFPRQCAIEVVFDEDGNVVQEATSQQPDNNKSKKDQ